jgi:hypothetical protein
MGVVHTEFILEIGFDGSSIRNGAAQIENVVVNIFVDPDEKGKNARWVGSGVTHEMSSTVFF